MLLRPFPLLFFFSQTKPLDTWIYIRNTFFKETTEFPRTANLDNGWEKCLNQKLEAKPNNENNIKWLNQLNNNENNIKKLKSVLHMWEVILIFQCIGFGCVWHLIEKEK